MSLLNFCGYGSPQFSLHYISNSSLIFPILTSIRVRLLSVWLFLSSSYIPYLCYIFQALFFTMFFGNIKSLFNCRAYRHITWKGLPSYHVGTPKKDITKINYSTNVIIAAEESRNLYELSSPKHDLSLMDNIIKL